MYRGVNKYHLGKAYRKRIYLYIPIFSTGLDEALIRFLVLLKNIPRVII